MSPPGEQTSARLGANRYGKSGIRLVRVLRDADPHRLLDWTVDIALEGDFQAAHTEGDNARVLPTDTMRGTVYAFAADQVGAPEDFALRLARHFVEHAGPVARSRVRIAAHPWARIGAHPHAFTRRDAGDRTVEVTVEAAATTVWAGITDARLLKTTDSGFAGFLRDRYTTLAETDDRILATTMTARWRYRGTDVDWTAAGGRVLSALLATFAGHDSRSVQHTAYAMGRAALDACGEVDEIELRMPNVHHVLVDLAPYGLTNEGEVLVATDRPYGVIEVTVHRGDGP